MSGIDLDHKIQELFKAPVATQENLAIWGGQIGVADLEDFLQAWKWPKLDMPWRIWEWASAVDFEREAGPPAVAAEGFRRPEWLERVHIFGKSGDLALRRDGECFLWRFVGRAGTEPPGGFFEAETDDYWRNGHAGRELQEKKRTVLLWGQEFQGHPGQWQDDRVAGARLAYPEVAAGKDGRVQLRYNEYIHGGSVEAVWWLNVEGWEVKNG